MLITCTSYAAEIDSHFIKAKNSFERSEYNHAVIHLKNSLRDERSHREQARYLLAKCYIQLGLPELAEVQLRLARLKKAVPSLKNKKLIVYSLILQNKLQQASQELADLDITTSGEDVAIIQDLMSLQELTSYLINSAYVIKHQYDNNGNATADTLLIRTYFSLEKQRYSEASKYISQALEQEPNNKVALFYSALLNFYNNKYRVVLDNLSQLSSNDPQNITATMLEIAALLKIDGGATLKENFLTPHLAMRANDHKLYVPELTKISIFPIPTTLLLPLVEVLESHMITLEGNSDTGHSKTNLLTHLMSIVALSYYELDNQKKVQYWLDKYQKAGGNSEALTLLRAKLFLLNGEPQESIKHLRLANMHGHDSVILYQLLGLSYLRANELSKAEQSFSQVLRAEPNNLITLSNIAKIYLFSGNAGRLIRLYENALTEIEYAFYLGPELLFIIATAYRQSNMYSEALQIIEHVITLSPNDSYAYQFKASLLGLLGRINESEQLYIKALKLEPENFQAAIHLARLTQAKGDTKTAVEILQQQLRFGSNSALYIELAGMHLLNNDTSRATVNYEKALIHNPQSVLAITNWSQLLFRLEGSGAAMSLIDKYIDGVANSAEIRLLKADLFLHDKYYEKALEQLNLALKLKPTLYEVLLKQAKIDLLLGNRTKAVDHLKQMLLKQSQHIEAWQLLIAIYTEDKNEAEALSALQKFSKVEQDESVILQLKGLLYWNLGQVDIAQNYYQWSMDNKTNRLAALGLYQVYRKKALIKEAENELQLWLDEQPNDLLFAITLSESFHQRGELKNALELYQRLLAQDKDNVVVLNNMAIVLAKLLHFSESLELINVANRLEPNNANILDTKGWILYKLQRYSDAIDILRHANNLTPHNAEIKYHLALVTEAMHNRAEARQLLLDAVNSEQNFYEKSEARVLLDSWSTNSSN